MQFLMIKNRGRWKFLCKVWEFNYIFILTKPLLHFINDILRTAQIVVNRGLASWYFETINMRSVLALALYSGVAP